MAKRVVYRWVLVAVKPSFKPGHGLVYQHVEPVSDCKAHAFSLRQKWRVRRPIDNIMKQNRAWQ